MRKALFLALMAASAVGSAQAQSINWAGWYVGAEVGQNEFSGNWSTTQTYSPDGSSPAATFSGTSSPTSPDMKDSGTVGAMTVGYNWLVEPRWIVGAEAKWLFGDQTKTINYIPGLDPTPDTTPGDGMFSTTTIKAKNAAMLRVRGGYLASPAMLIYGTAGLAYQRVEVAARCPADTFVCNPALGSRGTSMSKNLWGWTLGAGVEYAFAPQWTARLDYTYASYDSKDFVALQWESGASYGADARIKPRSQTMTAGVNFKF